MSCDNPFGLSLVPEPRRVPDPLEPKAGTHDAGTAPSAVPEAAPQPVPETPVPTAAVVLSATLPGSRMSRADRLRAFLKAQARKSGKKRGLASMVRSRLHKMHAGQPGSIASHRAHVKAAAWFPEELEGSWLKWVRFAWTAFHVTWCRFLKVLGSTLSSAGDHARTAFALLVLVIILVIYFA